METFKDFLMMLGGLVLLVGFMVGLGVIGFLLSLPIIGNVLAVFLIMGLLLTPIVVIQYIKASSSK
jgi:putative effector of murein hydrolase LrgA (UPF0299 family)